MVAANLNYRVRNKLEVFYSGGPLKVLPGEETLACASGDEVKIVRLADGTVSQTLPGDSEPVTALACSPDGRTVYVASRSLALRAWDLESGRVSQNYRGHRGPVAGADVHASGALLATCSADHTTRVWDSAGGFATHAFGGHRGVVLSVRFVPNELSLVTAGDDGDVRIWDLLTKTCSGVLKGHASAVTCLSLSADGSTLLSGSRDSTARLWDLRLRKQLAAIPVFEALEAAALLPSGESARWLVGPAAQAPPADAVAARRRVAFAVAGARGKLRVFRGDRGTVAWEQPDDDGSVTEAGPVVELAGLAAFAPGPGTPPGFALLSATQDGRLLVHSPPAVGAAGQGDAPSLRLAHHLLGNNEEVTSVLALSLTADPAAEADAAPGSSPAPLTHVAVATNSEVVRVLRTDGSLSCEAGLTGHSSAVLALASHRLSAGATLVASAGKDSVVRIHTLVVDPTPAAATARDGSATASTSAPGPGLARPRLVAVGTGHVGATSALAWAPRRGRLLASGGADGLLKLWDVGELPGDASSAPAPPTELSSPAGVAAHEKDVNAVSFSPDDGLVATASSDRTVRLWRAPDLVPTLTLRGHKRGVWDVAFSPVDRVLASASGDATLRIWSASDGACLRVLEGHGASVLRCRFAGAGANLASSGADGLLKVWAVRGGEPLASFDAADDKVWALDASTDAPPALLTGGADGSVAIWEDCTVQDVEERGEQALQNVLQEQKLANALKVDDLRTAAGLAFELKQPGRLLGVLTRALARDSVEGAFEPVAARAEGEDLRRLLCYIRDWNAHPKSCHAAAAALRAVLATHRTEELLAVPGVAALADALAAYSRRHLARHDRLFRETFLLDYVLESADVLTPKDP